MREPDATSGAVSFEQMVDLDQWETVEEFFLRADETIRQDVEECVRLRQALREELLKDAPEISARIKSPSSERWQWAREQLFGGHVCAIDGTVSRSPSLSGGRARIGVAATSYLGNQIKRVMYVSYRQMAEPFSSAIDYFTKLKQVNKTSDLLMRAVMAYAERTLALERKETWKFIHGELLPFELWAALGTDRPLETRLQLAKRLIEAKTIIGVVEGSHNVELLNAGELLRPGEYLEARDLTVELREYREGRRDDGRGAHFRREEAEQFDTFINQFGPKFKVGIFRAGLKTYVFQAHRDVFDEAAALILADSSHQPIRGFPLLIDYADHLLSRCLAQHDFERQIQFKMARMGLDVLGAEIDPRSTRRG